MLFKKKIFKRVDIYMFLVLIIRTLTSHEDLQKCLNAIKENAFHVSDYPVIVTLEDHLPPNLQGKVAKVRRIFFSFAQNRGALQVLTDFYFILFG